MDPTPIRVQTRGEEIANSVSHGVAFLGVLVAAPILILDAVRDGAATIVGASIFSATMAVLYLTSCLYHALVPGPAKKILRTVEHSAIYLLIAGTYTPFTLGVLHGAWGWSLFGVIWGLAALGIFFKVTGILRHEHISTVFYVAMGWVVLVAIRPLTLRMPMEGFVWIFMGGIAYTLGTFFYVNDHKPFRHFIWHLFVVAGTVFHFFAVLWYAT